LDLLHERPRRSGSYPDVELVTDRIAITLADAIRWADMHGVEFRVVLMGK
jgi:hypothetical protein